jgi:hypothetical protein
MEVSPPMMAVAEAVMWQLLRHPKREILWIIFRLFFERVVVRLGPTPIVGPTIWFLALEPIRVNSRPFAVQLLAPRPAVSEFVTSR